MSLREDVIAASKRARHEWLSTHLGRGQDALDQAIADAAIAIVLERAAAVAEETTNGECSEFADGWDCAASEIALRIRQLAEDTP